MVKVVLLKLLLWKRKSIKANQKGWTGGLTLLALSALNVLSRRRLRAVARVVAALPAVVHHKTTRINLGMGKWEVMVMCV